MKNSRLHSSMYLLLCTPTSKRGLRSPQSQKKINNSTILLPQEYRKSTQACYSKNNRIIVLCHVEVEVRPMYLSMLVDIYRTELTE